ncbi:MAG TPA: hypothetical protein VJ816_12465 [Gemmatimonadales bacterium]|nr:hypothetical protein [Gemmatimonadales bacterium]
MFKVILWSQWKWTRLPLLGFVLGAFALPLFSARGASVASQDNWLIEELLSNLQTWGLAYPVLAGLLGLILARATWGPDHQGKHVYALSLPLPRWDYVLMRFAAGALLLVIPVLALWAGALVATVATTLPPSLQAYPTILALRFALAALVAYAVIFAISAGTNRTAGIILASLAAVIAVQIFLEAVGIETMLVQSLLTKLVLWPGPFEIFTGRWMLFDV